MIARALGVRISKLALAATALTVFGSNVAAAADPPCRSGRGTGRAALRLVALTSDSRLFCVSELGPRFARPIGQVTLNAPDTALIGIDFRVQDGLLYGVGNGGGVYMIDVATGQATLVNSLTVPLVGASFGVDFNPAADRLRIVSDTGQNLRHNVNAGGVTVDDGAANGPLRYTAGTTALGITGAGYTNNDLAPATATTLFDLDTTLDQIAVQSPANNGTLAATGQLGVDAPAVAGFDVYSYIRNGGAFFNRAFAVFKSGSTTNLYLVEPLTGKAFRAGSFRLDVVDIAVPLNQ